MFHRLSAAFTFFLLLSLSSCVISPRRGGTTGGGGGTGTGQLYVVNSSANAILRFAGATAANGNVNPKGNLAGSSTLLSSPKRVLVDAANNRLYIANAGAGQSCRFVDATFQS
jgi:hypothetical protein